MPYFVYTESKPESGQIIGDVEKAAEKKDPNKIIIYFEEYGNKNALPIILIHGWLCNADFWKDFLPLSSEYRLIIPELRGHGRSPPAKDVSIEALAGDIIALMNKLGIKKAVIIGHSMGGLVAQQIYHTHKDAVVALGLWNTGGRIPFGYGIGTSFYVLRLIMFILTLVITYPIPPLFRWVLKTGWKLGFAKKGQSDAYRSFIKEVIKMNRKSVLKSAFALKNFNRLKDLGNIDVPVMIIHGENDRYITPHQLAEKMHKSIPINYYYVIDETAHFSVNEKPEEVIEHLRKFLTDIKYGS